MREFRIDNDICSLEIYPNEINSIKAKESYPEQIVFISLVNNLLDNGQAQIVNNTIEFSTEVLYHLLDYDDIVGLEIPKITSNILFIKGVGNHNSSDFVFTYEYYDFYPYGKKINYIFKNGILIKDGNISVATSSQYQILKLIDEHYKLGQENRSAEYNLMFLYNIKKLSSNPTIELDSYLRNEEVVFADKINLDIIEENGRAKLIPSIDKSIDDSFQKHFNLYPTVKATYPTQEKNSTSRKRVVLNCNQVNSLKKVKTVNKLEDKQEIISIIDNPSNHFDLESIDVSNFYSDRVIEIGLYKPKFSRFVTLHKSEWIPGINIAYQNNGVDQIIVRDKEELEELSTNINLAEKHEKYTVNFQQHSMPMESAKALERIATEQFKSKEPIKEIDGEIIHQKKVLIIKDNNENLDYQITDTETYSEDSKKEITHSLFQINNLTKGITLKDHQIEGIAWLQNLYNEGYDGCLLADDMGLGKTLQVLYMIEWLGQNSKPEYHEKPILITAPISLLENWQSEYARFFSEYSYKVLPFYGTTNYKKNTLDNILLSDLSQRQIILTNYETLRSYQLTLCAVDFHLVVLDEAQRIKTPGTLVTNAAKALKSRFKIAMSGTPVENSLIDLWCITDFAIPGLLGSAKLFKDKYQRPLANKSLDLSLLGEQLRTEMGILLKRRLKTDVAKDLPNKHKSNSEECFEKFTPLNIVCKMPYIQEEKYKDAISSLKNSDKPHILSYINRIKEISDHPFLGEEKFSDYSVKELVESSARVQATLEILERISSLGEKVIIFAERRDVQKMLQKILKCKYDINASIINGDTPTSSRQLSINNISRQETINRFSSTNGFNALILSPIAAGVGLNIVCANHVIHYSRHWNPAKEEQATDRAYRIGQTKDVYVYYPMAESSEFKSFDIVLNELLERKLALATHTLFPTEQVEVNISEVYSSLTNN
ncbi:MAG: DEAD/DEAH box helicase [Bacteroidales bacterium]